MSANTQVKTCGLACELVCNTNLLSGGFLNGPLLYVQVGLAILSFVFGIVESVLAYWNSCKVRVQLDLDRGMGMV